jgi:hypothetical protein
LAVYTAENFTLFVRSSFDLYRFELLKQFRVPLPSNNLQELDTWGTISELLGSGYDLSLVPANLDYCVNDELSEEASDSDQEE